jgi:hypothetical protein
MESVICSSQGIIFMDLYRLAQSNMQVLDELCPRSKHWHFERPNRKLTSENIAFIRNNVSRGVIEDEQRRTKHLRVPVVSAPKADKRLRHPLSWINTTSSLTS